MWRCRSCKIITCSCAFYSNVKVAFSPAGTKLDLNEKNERNGTYLSHSFRRGCWAYSRFYQQMSLLSKMKFTSRLERRSTRHVLALRRGISNIRCESLRRSCLEKDVRASVKWIFRLRTLPSDPAEYSCLGSGLVSHAQ